MNTLVNDYLYSFNINNIDNTSLYKKCLAIEKVIFATTPAVSNGVYGNQSTARHNYYNIFNFPVLEINQLYKQLSVNTKPLLEKDTQYVLKGWLNSNKTFFCSSIFNGSIVIDFNSPPTIKKQLYLFILL